MSLAVLLVLAAVLSLVVIASFAVSRSLQLPENGSVTRIQPVDIDAFRNLVDPHEAEYLRLHLPAWEFRRVQRKRLRAAAAYVRTAGQNAVFLIRMGQVAVTATDPRAVEAARQLVDEALRLRRNAAFALVRIQVARLWPNAGFAAAPVLEGYHRVTGSAMLLGRLQNPATPVRILASR